MKRILASLTLPAALWLATPAVLAQGTENFDELFEQCAKLAGQAGLEACDRAIEIDPNNPTLWLNRGVVLHETLGQTQEAVASLNQAIALDPDYSLALYNRCVGFLALDRFQDAIDSCGQAIEGDGQWGGAEPASAWNARGAAFFNLNRFAEALTAFEEALKLNPNHPNARRNADLARQRLGDS